MNPYSGHLVRLENEAALEAFGEKYQRIPAELQAEAEKALGGARETRIDLRRGSPLSAWAKKKRKEKIAAKSRRINRQG